MSEEKELKKCSRCHSTKLIEHFSINSKGELLKTCINCRSYRNSYDAEWRADNPDKVKESKNKSYEKSHAKPLEEIYSICDVCGSNVGKLSEGMARHKKRWSCFKTTMPGEPGRKEFYEWVLKNQHGGLKDYVKHIKEAEEYLSKN